MTVFVRGVTRTINAGFNGKVYGPIIWTAVPAASMVLAPAAGGLTCKATPPIDAPAGAVAISVSSLDRFGKKIGGTLSVTLEAVQAPPPPPPDPLPAPDKPWPGDGLGPVDRVRFHIGGAEYVYPDGLAYPDHYVLFRPYGVKVHRGSIGPFVNGIDTANASNLGPHAVSLEYQGKVVAEFTVRSHGWHQQWTYRSAPLSVKQTPAQIVAARRMFAFGDTGAAVGQVGNYIFKGPMDSAGITKYMPTTGERPDIGLITDAAASYMLGRGAGPMLAWAQAAGSCPVHLRDQTTGRRIDVIQYPKANFYPDSQNNHPWIFAGPKMADGYRRFADDWTPQIAHYCEMSYLAYMATQDMGFLEDLQDEANFVFLPDASQSTDTVAILWGELRGLAWGLRQLFMAHIATKDAEARGPLPPELHPSSYFKTLLDNQLVFWSRSMADPKNQTFRLFSGGDRFGPWQADYTIEALAFGVLTGHSDWAQFFLFCLGNVIARTNGTSGYPPGYGVGYYMNRLPWLLDAQGKPISGSFDTAAKPMGWGESARYCMTVDPDGSPLTPAQVATLQADPLNGGKAMSLNESMMTSRSVLIMADHLDANGILDVRVKYPELTTCIKNATAMTRSYGSMNPRASTVAAAIGG